MLTVLYCISRGKSIPLFETLDSHIGGPVSQLAVFHMKLWKQHLHRKKEVKLVCFKSLGHLLCTCKVNFTNLELKSIQGTLFIAFKIYVIINV